FPWHSYTLPDSNKWFVESTPVSDKIDRVNLQLQNAKFSFLQPLTEKEISGEGDNKEVTISLALVEAGNPLNIQLKGLSETNMASILDFVFSLDPAPAIIDETQEKRDLLSPRLLREILLFAKANGATIESPAGDSIDQIVNDYFAKLALPVRRIETSRSIPPSIKVSDIRSAAESGLISEPATMLEPPPPEGPLRWIDIERPTAELLGQLKRNFHLRPMEIADCLRFDNSTRVDRVGDHVMIGFHLLGSPKSDPGSLILNEIQAFVGPNYVITVHDKPIESLERIRAELEAGSTSSGENDTSTLTYKLLHAVMHDNQKVIDSLELHIAEMMRNLQAERLRSEDIRSTLPNLSESLMRMRQLISPQTEIPEALGTIKDLAPTNGSDFGASKWNSRCHRALRDIERLQNSISIIQQTQLSVVSNKTNEIMKKIAV
ncbi:MAG: hypothetical protein KDD53_11610, partial [Bdellovibrionales bacterium]|nr:hypothetical protein [Bdellovibrionales bacterium]